MITSLGVFSESKHNAHPIFPLTTLHRATSKHKAACSKQKTIVNQAADSKQHTKNSKQPSASNRTTSSKQQAASRNQQTARHIK